MQRDLKNEQILQKRLLEQLHHVPTSPVWGRFSLGEDLPAGRKINSDLSSGSC